MQTGIAFIALSGIVVNNNIVLIDTFNVLKKNNPNFSSKELALRTAVLRLRPVFLTHLQQFVDFSYSFRI
ncbi:MAG: hypothetical protein Ct9H90mP4_03190 [Gammaproteobacteria bacterium]|nr:MAG: hypothetical protein Ct9H90mP4_03190 [Gammaproteobacteria bacterium]